MAFDIGAKPTIALIDRSTRGIDLALFRGVLQRYVSHCVAPIWGTPAKLVTGSDFVPSAWAVTFLDNADQANALAYHDLTPDGLPLANVFVETIASYAVSYTHLTLPTNREV